MTPRIYHTPRTNLHARADPFLLTLLSHLAFVILSCFLSHLLGQTSSFPTASSSFSHSWEVTTWQIHLKYCRNRPFSHCEALAEWYFAATWNASIYRNLQELQHIASNCCDSWLTKDTLLGFFCIFFTIPVLSSRILNVLWMNPKCIVLKCKVEM